MNDRLSVLGDKALPYIQEQDEDYYNIFLPAIKAPYIVKYIPEELGDFEAAAESNSEYDGQMGNTCFGLIMGTLADGERTAEPCTVTERCWQFMTTYGTVGYYTTHQLLYFIYGEHSGCEHVLQERIRRHNRTSVRDFTRYLCQQIYYDATFRDENGKIDVRAEDLFMEQTLLCGVLGFQYFLKEKWMRKVLSWQTARGCFTNPASLMEIELLVEENRYEAYELYKHLSKEGDHMDEAKSSVIRQRIFDLAEDKETLLAIQQHRVFMINNNRGVLGKRKLLSEHVMGGDCLAHKTGLGAGTLATYLRFLTRQLYGYN